MWLHPKARVKFMVLVCCLCHYAYVASVQRIGKKIRSTGGALIGLQARYNFSLTAPEHLTTLFNTRQLSASGSASSSAPAGGLSRRSFELTPPMSSYLVAFVVGNLTNASALVPGATPMDERRTVSVWGTPDRYIGMHERRRSKLETSGE